jgi:hypothetical protein
MALASICSLTSCFAALHNWHSRHKLCVERAQMQQSPSLSCIYACYNPHACMHSSKSRSVISQRRQSTQQRSRTLADIAAAMQQSHAQTCMHQTIVREQ